MNKIKHGLFHAISIILFINCVAFAASKKVEITGMLRVGSSDSAIDSEGGESVSFSSSSAIAEKNFSKCEARENCYVSAIVDDYGGIETLIDVKKVARKKMKTKEGKFLL